MGGMSVGVDIVSSQLNIWLIGLAKNMQDKWEEDIEREAQLEVLKSDPVYQRFSMVEFVSSSKGRGRVRKSREEIQLVQDESIPGKWTTFEKLKFDELATEVYGASDPNYYSGNDERLKSEIQSKAYRL